ncbi:MAG: class I SAM-dependent methyltransferase [Bacteriovoracaceae bacterium]|jgi:predicted O-methyltransferase YrrM|nr:class I SAM-dependent methyltransferase [Bacteriovoracaceae bacterium]
MNWPKIWSEIKTIEGWLNYPVARKLYKTASKVPTELPIVEIGSWKGRSTVLLAKSSFSKIYAIDPHQGSSEHQSLIKGPVDTYEEFCQNITKHGVRDQVIDIRKKSIEAINDVPSKIGMLWIDGSHDHKDVLDDYQTWFPKLAVGGVVLFHDSKWPGVKKVLWENLYLSKEVSFVRRVEDTTYARKVHKNNFISLTANLLTLFFYKNKQKYKRLKRKMRKKWSLIKLNF